MAELYQDIPEALENTERIAEMCNLELDSGGCTCRRSSCPPGKTADEYLADLCHEGLPRYYPDPLRR